jgi:uncharacterized protein (PEP-CTERM system associated)
LTTLAAAIGCVALSGVAHAERWTATASAGGTETYNHNSGAGQPSDGFVTSLTAALGFNGEGARLKINGTVSGTESLYAGQGQGNTFAPSANIAGHIEAIEQFFFVDATVNVSQTYISPFGPQPSNVTVPTNNRYTTESYSVSPYIKGVLGSQVAYLVRDDSGWTTSQTFGDSSLKTPGTYWNNLDAEANSVADGHAGWSAQYNRQYYDSGAPGTGTYLLQVARAIGSYRVDPQLELSIRGGYEKDSFPQESAIGNSTEGSIYGGGLHWRPTDRTDLSGFWEHHFYGSAYSWQLTHRLPNIALAANFTRGLTSFPQIALLIPAGVPVAQFIDAAFTTRIPDPVERAQAVAQFLAQSGLPPTLVSPLNVYATTVTLQNTATLTAVWIGVLNSIAFSVFRSESEAVSGQGSTLPPELQFAANNVQTGGGVSYSHRLTPLTNLFASATYTAAKPNGTETELANVRTRNYNTSVGLNTQFGPKTSGTVGLSYFVFDAGGVGGKPSTLSAYATISHTF